MPLWDVIDPFLLLTGGNLHNQPAKSVTVGRLRIMKQSSQIQQDVNTKPWILLWNPIIEVPAVMVSLSNKEWIRLLITATDM